MGLSNLTAADPHTATHEAGHAIILLSCGVGQLDLSYIDITTDEGSRGRNSISMPTRTHIFDIPLAETPAVSATLALIACGGIVAEKLLGYPGTGFGTDQRLLVVQLLDLIGATRAVLENAAQVLDPDWKEWDSLKKEEKKNRFNRWQDEINEYARTLCQFDLNSASASLLATAEDRIERSVSALKNLRDKLLVSPRLDATNIHEILTRSEWCGAEGAPTIPGYYPSRSINKFASVL